MTNYKEIETYLKHGIHVLVKHKDGEYQIISPMKDDEGNYRTSNWYDTPEEAKQNIGENTGNSNLEEQCKSYTDITPFHLDFEPYPVGMKVIGKGMKSLGTIEKITASNNYHVYFLESNTTLTNAPHTELIPYFEEEVEKSISSLEMTIKQIEEKLNITGLKIVK